jgi:hypothetical protein
MSRHLGTVQATCAHWARSESTELETLLRTQNRVPGNLTLEVT